MEIDWAYALIGAAGALFAVYLAKQEIPEFRLLGDSGEKEGEIRDRTERAERDEKDLRDLIAKVKDAPANQAQNAIDAMNRLDGLLGVKRQELDALLREQKKIRLIAKLGGLILYVVFGGFFACILTGRVTIEGISGDVSLYLQSFVIGATWTTYLSTIGFATGQAKVDEGVEKLKGELSNELEKVKEDLAPQVKKRADDAEKATFDPNTAPVAGHEIENLMNARINQARQSLSTKFDGAKVRLRKECRGAF